MLLDKLTQDLVNSLKSRDKRRTETLRFLISGIKKFEIDTYPPSSDKKLTDEDVLKIIQKQVKTHKESIAAFEKAGRQDLVKKESEELAILESYLPKGLSDDEVKTIVEAVLSLGTTNFGQVMGVVMKQVGGRADGNKVAQIVKEELSK